LGAISIGTCTRDTACPSTGCTGTIISTSIICQSGKYYANAGQAQAPNCTTCPDGGQVGSSVTYSRRNCCHHVNGATHTGSNSYACTYTETTFFSSSTSCYKNGTITDSAGTFNYINGICYYSV
jgi:hypothetical protein